MKGKVDFRIPIIILLSIVLTIMCYFYFKEENNQTIENDMFDFWESNQKSNNSKSNKIIVSATSEVTSSLSENIELHATYYLEESYLKTNQIIKAGEKILKYTNENYLKAPYDCVVTNINIPDEEEQCTNEHYIEISSINNLQVQFKIDETKLDSIQIGQEARVEITSYENKEIEGYITDISSTASNGKFVVTVEFENDGGILLGMTANITI